MAIGLNEFGSLGNNRFNKFRVDVTTGYKLIENPGDINVSEGLTFS